MKFSLFALILVFSISNSFCQSNNLTIHKSGNGKQQIILVSGLACKTDIWNRTLDSLSADATVFTIDYYNDSGHQLTTINDIASQILNWMNKKDMSKPIIIGHSLGGVIALNVASKLNGNIKKLIIIDSYPAISALSNPNFASNPNNNCSPFVEKFSSMEAEQFKNFQMSNYAQMTLNATERTKLVDWVTGYDRINYSNLLCDYINTDLRTSISSIVCPTLILGSMPMSALKENIGKQYETMKTHTIKYSQKGLHFLMVDDFDWYMGEIKNFIE